MNKTSIALSWRIYFQDTSRPVDCEEGFELWYYHLAQPVLKETFFNEGQMVKAATAWARKCGITIQTSGAR